MDFANGRNLGEALRLIACATDQDLLEDKLRSETQPSVTPNGLFFDRMDRISNQDSQDSSSLHLYRRTGIEALKRWGLVLKILFSIL